MTFDAVLVPGGGLEADGTPPPWVRNRLDLARQRRTGSTAIIALSLGTVHRSPPLDDRGFPVAESVAGARYLIQTGVPADFVLFEAASLDTVGNAYFARTIHTDPAGMRRLLVVTSEFHMPRTRAIFEWVFSLDPQEYFLHFETVPDVGMAQDILAARRARESASLATVSELRKRLTSMRELHRWLFSEHAAYATELPQTAIGAAEQSY